MLCYVIFICFLIVMLAASVLFSNDMMLAYSSLHTVSGLLLLFRSLCEAQVALDICMKYCTVRFIEQVKHNYCCDKWREAGDL